MVEKYGFIYIWYDRFRKMYYVGCHWGNENDNYICSSNRMRKAYKRRQHDFKRRIITRIYSSRQELLEIENQYLSLIKDRELGIKYYNLTKHMNGHWSTDEDRLLTIGEKISKKTKGRIPPNKGISMYNETKKKLSEKLKGIPAHNKGVPCSEETKQKISNSLKGNIPGNKGVPMSDETRKKVSEKLKGRTAHNKGVPMSDEQKELLRKANTGRVISEETRQKLKNRKASDETKQQMSESIKCLKWYNNGIKNTRAKECPGPDWIAGRIYNINSL